MALPMMLRSTEREIRVSLRLWRTSVFELFATPILTLGALGVGLGGMIERDPDELNGLAYIEFVTPGLLIAAALQSAAGRSSVAGDGWSPVARLPLRRGVHADRCK